MVYPVSFLRHTLLWTLADGEVAQCRIHWRPSSSLITLSGEVDTLATRGASLWSDIKGGYDPAVEYVGSRVALISIDGITVETEERASFGIPGSNESQTPLPTEVALCASFRTATYSRSGRGRAYLPGPSTAAVDSAGRVDSAYTPIVAAGMAAYLAPFSVGAVDFDSCIASATQQQLRAITEVRIGNVFDVQRRRRDALTEVWTIEPV